MLIIETLQRKRYISIVHVAWLGTYAAIFLIAFPPKLWNWGAFVFGWSGCMLPLLISAGVFGDDIASGRIGLLVTKPVRVLELYVFRLLGLSLQGALHLTAAGVLIFGLHRLTGRGSIDHLATWLLAAWLIFNTWVALSTSVSVVAKRERNAMVVFVVAVAAVFAVSAAVNFFPEAIATKLLMGVMRYACPPVEFLVGLAKAEHSLIRGLGDVGHSLILTVCYAAVGILILGMREFKRAGD
jgi:hypothetical protein